MFLTPSFVDAIKINMKAGQTIKFIVNEMIK